MSEHYADKNTSTAQPSEISNGVNEIPKPLETDGVVEGSNVSSGEKQVMHETMKEL